VPTLATIGPYRFFFFSNEGFEPAHVHVERDSSLAKFWLDPVSLAKASGFTARELRQIEQIVSEYAGTWKAKWNEYFGS